MAANLPAAQAVSLKTEHLSQLFMVSFLLAGISPSASIDTRIECPDC